MTPAAASLHIGLTSSAGWLAEALEKPARDGRPQADLQFSHNNERVLLDDLEAGGLDAVLVHWLPADSELWFNPVALDGIVFVVHPSNPVDELSLAQAHGLLTGKVGDWPAVGGDEQPVVLILRENSAGLRRILSERLLSGQSVSPDTLIVSYDLALREKVASEPGALGALMRGNLGALKALELDGVAAGPETLASQAYPLTAPLYFVSPAEPQGALRAWLAWLQSAEGQTLIGENVGRVR
ncbi:MAG: substrate-binding domain-containing protein [Candidatus Promineifilaceae bacterium]